MMLMRGGLPEEWQREILIRLESLIDGTAIKAHDPRQLNLF